MVRNKLKKVLWIPIQGEREIPLKERQIGQPILWTPSIEQEILLKKDWEELMEYIILGKSNQITARIGNVLQLRPKASNKKEKTYTIDENNQQILVNPLGFYLRKEFTKKILYDFLI